MPENGSGDPRQFDRVIQRIITRSPRRLPTTVKLS